MLSSWGPPRGRKRTRPGQRRQHAPIESVEPECNDMARMASVQDGNWMLQKVSNQIIR